MTTGTRRALLVVIVAAVAAGATWAAATRHFDRRLTELWYFAEDGELELAPIAKKYGPHRNSRTVEEWLIRDYFQDRRDGVFLDVGANHYQSESNTYFLEKELGWSGVAVDPLVEFAADYKRHRPRTTFVAMFASDVPDTTVQFFVPERNKLVASSDRAFTEQVGSPGRATTVPATTLNALLAQAAVERLDFMSMDIELAEPKALAGFDVERYRPSLVCIEGHAPVRQQILDYFARHGYTVVAKYLRVDPKNLYFQPLSRPGV